MSRLPFRGRTAKRKLNTFERQRADFKKFLENILSWRPDYIVPVAKKGCKLLKASSDLTPIDPSLVRYRLYFELNRPPIGDRRIAVVDDATQFTSTLLEYRRYFENLGAAVRTFSFVGHEGLFDGTREKYDEHAEICKFFPGPVYQEYIIQQSYFLLEHGSQYDLDHLVFRAQLPPQELSSFLSPLAMKGDLLHIEDYFTRTKASRFSLDDVEFFNNVPFLAHPSISTGPIRKIKFVYNEEKQTLFFSPLVFPTWEFNRGEFDGDLFLGVPFELPFKPLRWVDKRDRSGLLRTYYNIWYTFTASLAKAFLESVRISGHPLQCAQLERGDLDATLGVESTSRFISAVAKFLEDPETNDFVSPRVPSGPSHFRKRFTRFADVVDHLKNTYERNRRRRKSWIGYHYNLPYEDLFSAFDDKTLLSENLDYYCDLGAIVPETDIQDGRILRACRTGEVLPDYDWMRTRVLIPLVIEQWSRQTKAKSRCIGATALNKLLANFVFDYPSEIHHELHCLIGVPYTYGTLVRVYHHLRAPSKPSIYKTEAISPYYEWDPHAHRFSTVDGRRQDMLRELAEVFEEQQEVPYSEILTYFRLLSRVSQFFGKVDVLNLLALCRN